MILVLILAATASIFSLRTKRDFLPSPLPVTAPVVIPNPPEPERPAPIVAPAHATIKATPRPWPQASSDIAPDSKATFGTLDNGLRYIIYPNSEPPKRVSLRLHIASGSLMEADDQQGLAHFIEHMVFNGSKNFKADELVPIMQRMQIAFGADVNAHTSFDETVYMLDIPDLADDAMKLGFTVMRDYADGALLAASEIDKERGVILSEKVSRDTVSSRIMEQQFAKILPSSLVARRFPIGKENVIKTAQRERFVDFYNNFYTPQRMTFIVVGDIDPKNIQGQIEKYFASMTPSPKPATSPDLGPIKQPEGLETSVFADKELSSTEVSLTLVRPLKEKPDTVATRLENMTLDMANSMLSRRFERLSKVEGSAIASGSASKNELFNYLELGSIDVTAADDRWKEAVPVLEQEFRRAIEHGFSDAELAEAKSNQLNAYEQQLKQKPTRKSEVIATALADASNEQSVFSDPATDLEIAQKALASITIESCHQAFKSFWDAPGFHLILTTKEKPDKAEMDLAALFEDSRGKPVQPPATRALQVFDYSNFGKPGSIASRKEITDLGITQLILSNHVHINLKRTDFEKGKIRMSARIGAGKLTQPKDKPMLDSFASAVFEGGGIGKHSNDDLEQLLAGKNVSATLTIGEDAFVLSGATTPADFTLQTQLMCATLTDPGYREEGLWQFQKAVPMMYQQLNHTPAGPQQEMEAWLYGGDSRFTIAPIEKLSSYTIADAKKWLTPELAKGYMELTIVGDFEMDTILPDLLATFGALPTRLLSPPILTTARKLNFPNAPAAKTFTYDSKIAQASAVTIWKAPGVRGNQKLFRRFNILADIYGDRLREEIREKLGASYSPSAGASGSDAFEDIGYVIGESVGKPEDLDLLLNTMRDLADEFAKTGATADELDRALEPTFGQLAKSLRDNKYWLTTVMSQCQLDPSRLDLARTRDADYHSITLAEINELAKKYMVAENALLISIKPAN